MKDNKKMFLIFFAVFIISFLWQFSLTYNFNYFWEDNGYLDAHQEYLQNPAKYSFLRVTGKFLKTLNAPVNFYRIEYNQRPLAPMCLDMSILFHKFLLKISGNVLIVDRILKSFLFGCYAVIVFCFFYIIGDKERRNYSKLVIASLLLGYFLVLPETWLFVLYFCDELLITMLMAALSLAVFYFYYNNDSLKNKFLLAVLFFFIVFTAYISILIKHVGRINFAIILLFLFFTKKKKILTWKYGLLILVLLFLSVPLFGMFSKGSLGGISDYMNLDGNNGIFSILIRFLTTFRFSFSPHAFYLLLLFGLFFVFHLYAFFRKKNCSKTPEVAFLRGLVIFSSFWFLFTAITSFMARGFIFDPLFFLRFEFSVFIVPQALFLASYSQFVYKKYFSAKKGMQYIIYIFIILAFIQNAKRLNEWRGGWGSYFLGYDTARQYIDSHAKNAIMLIQPDHLPPVYFTSTNKVKMAAVNDLTNPSVLRLYQKEYALVYIVHRSPLVFIGPSIVNEIKLTIKDDSPYGKFKKIIGKYYPEPMYIYEVNVAPSG